MSELIELVEALTGPCRKADMRITGYIREGVRHPDFISPPRYTGSIDAAMTLVREGWDYCITPRNGVWVRQSEHFPAIHGNAATPAIALCIAALKARESVTA